MASTVAQPNLVNAVLAGESRRVNVHIDNGETLCDAFIEAAKVLEQSKNVNGVEATKQCVKSLLESQAALTALKNAVDKVQRQYKLGETETDFAAEMQTATEQAAQQANFQAEEHPKFRALLQELCEGGKNAEAVDEELTIAPGDELALNRNCPLTGKQVLEILEPVEDGKGFVYEKAAIEAYIRRQPGGVATAPISGTDHQVRISDLKAARKVIRAQRRAKQMPTQTQRANEGILDVD